MEDLRDLVTFSDDEGNEFELEVVDYFDYEDQEYAVLIDPETECDCDEDEACDCATEVYIMKVVINGEYEELLPADEDMMDVLSKIVEERLACGCECDDCDEDCDDDDCECCHHHED